MYGKNAFPFLSVIAARAGRGIGRVLLSVLLANFLSTAALSATNADMERARSDAAPAAAQSYIICTPQGLKRITLDKKGNPVEDKAGPKYCIYCLPFHKVNISVFSVEIPFLDSEYTTHRVYFDHLHQIIFRLVLDKSRTPRAPPLG